MLREESHLLDQLKRLLTSPLPTTEGQQPTPDPSVVAEQFKITRLHGRQGPSLTELLTQEALRSGQAWPVVIGDEGTGTLTVPTTFEGLMALVARWDSLLLDEELKSLRNLVNNMVPMGVLSQTEVRKARFEAQQEWEHMKEHHPDVFERAQGGRA